MDNEVGRHFLFYSPGGNVSRVLRRISWWLKSNRLHLLIDSGIRPRRQEKSALGQLLRPCSARRIGAAGCGSQCRGWRTKTRPISLSYTRWPPANEAWTALQWKWMLMNRKRRPIVQPRMTIKNWIEYSDKKKNWVGLVRTAVLSLSTQSEVACC